MLIFNVMEYTWNHPANRNRRLRAMGTMFGWQAWKRLVRKPWTIPVFDGLKMRCHLNNTVAGVMIYSGGWPDYDEMHFVKRYLRPGDDFLDVGANIGMYTLLAASRIGKQGHIVAIEGARAAYERYLENVELNQLSDQVELLRAAVAAEPGTIRFLQQNDQTNRIALNNETGQAGAEFEEVEAITLDQAAAGRKFAMGKIDIEGAEPMAFQGAHESLSNANPPVWLMELKARLLKKFDATPEQLAGKLKDYGYELGVYDADRNDLSFPETPWHDHGNVFAIASQHIDFVQNRLAEWNSGTGQAKG